MESGICAGLLLYSRRGHNQILDGFMPTIPVSPASQLSPFWCRMAVWTLLFGLGTCLSMECCQREQASHYDPSTPIEAGISADFIKYWLPLALDFSANTSASSHQLAARWMKGEEAARQTRKTFWAGHERMPLTAFAAESITNLAVFDSKSAGLEVKGTLTRNDRTKIPVFLHFVVRKEDEGYRIESFELDHFQNDFQGSLICNGLTSPYLLLHDQKAQYDNRKQALKAIDSLTSAGTYSPENEFFRECVNSVLAE